MPTLIGMHILGMVMWTGGLLSALRIMIELTKESAVVRPRFSYLVRGFMRYTALSGAIISIVTGVALLAIHTMANSIGPTMLAKLLLVLILAGFHISAAAQSRKISADPASYAGVSARALTVGHHVVMALLLGLIVLSTLSGHEG